LPAQLGQLRITDGYARSTVPKQANGAAWLSISNSGKQGDKLLRASSPLAERVELHTSSMEGGMMRMREIDDLALPAGGNVNMQPGNGAHLMLIGLKQPLLAGQKLPLVLEFDKAGKLHLEIAIKPLAP
jgi:copper(I)-binding protein